MRRPLLMIVLMITATPVYAGQPTVVPDECYTVTLNPPIGSQDPSVTLCRPGQEDL